MKIIEFKASGDIKIDEFEEFIRLLKENKLKTVVLAALKTNGEAFTQIAGDSVIERCGLLAFLDVDVKQGIEI